jgi:hypothetical protein
MINSKSNSNLHWIEIRLWFVNKERHIIACAKSRFALNIQSCRFFVCLTNFLSSKIIIFQDDLIIFKFFYLISLSQKSLNCLFVCCVNMNKHFIIEFIKIEIVKKLMHHDDLLNIEKRVIFQNMILQYNNQETLKFEIVLKKIWNWILNDKKCLEEQHKNVKNLTNKHFIIAVIMKKTKKIKKFAKKALNRIIIKWDSDAKDFFQDLSIHQFKLIKKIVMSKMKFEKTELKMNQIIIIKLKNFEREVFKNCVSQSFDWEKVYKKISLTLFVKSCIFDEMKLKIIDEKIVLRTKKTSIISAKSINSNSKMYSRIVINENEKFLHTSLIFRVFSFLIKQLFHDLFSSIFDFSNDINNNEQFILDYDALNIKSINDETLDSIV